MNRPTNPVIEATTRASELVFTTFDQIWHQMELGKTTQLLEINDSLNELETMRQKVIADHEAHMVSIDAMRERLVAALNSAQETAVVMQGLVGTPPEAEPTFEVPFTDGGKPDA